MKNVLWIDDDTAFATMAADYLKAWSFRVDVQPRPPESTQEVLRYHAVVWDHSFAAGPEHAFLAQVRETPQGRRLPILLLFARPMTLAERLFANQWHLSHGSKYVLLWELLQRLQNIVE